jgi:hypothetical protein
MTTPGIGGVDVGGNPFGHDLHRWDDHHIDHGQHHDASSIGGSFDHWSSTGSSGFDPWRD